MISGNSQAIPTTLVLFLACFWTSGPCLAKARLNFSQIGVSFSHPSTANGSWGATGENFPIEEPSPTLLKAQEALLAFPESGWRIDYGIGGWKSNPWFGKYAHSSTGWLYHHALGWVYLKQKSIDSIWLWQEELDWVWTNHTVFPYFFQNQPEGWLSLEPSSSQPALVYDFGNSVWFELGRPFLSISVSTNLAGTGSVMVPENARKGDDLSVFANPQPGYVFTGWEGDYETGKNPLVFENLQENLNLTANFAPVAEAFGSDTGVQLDYLEDPLQQDQAKLELALFGSSSLVSVGGDSEIETKEAFSSKGSEKVRFLVASGQLAREESLGIFDRQSDQLTHPFLPLSLGSQNSLVWEGLRRSKATLRVEGYEEVMGTQTVRISLTSPDEEIEKRWLAQDVAGNLWLIKSSLEPHSPFPMLPAYPAPSWKSWDAFSSPPLSHSVALSFPTDERASGLGLVSGCLKVMIRRNSSVQVETYAPTIGLIKISQQ